MANELQVIDSQETLPVTTMDKLLMAVQSGLSADMLERFMDLAERNEKQGAEKAFNAAYAEYKKNIPTVKPDEKGKIKTKSGFVIEWDYVSLGKLSAEIAKAMAPFGLSFDWDTEQNGPTITVSCFVRHSLGHFRKVALSCGPDTSGDKSAIHAIKSTITYLKKATLEMASGVSMSEHDDDGVESGASYPETKTTQRAPVQKKKSVPDWENEADAHADTVADLASWYDDNRQEIAKLPELERKQVNSYVKQLKDAIAEKEAKPETITCPENGKEMVKDDCLASECHNECANFTSKLQL